jgi:hypothetical protein
MVKTPKGELSSTELRKLIKAHNILVSIKIPKGTDRDGLIKLIENKGYKVDHEKKKLTPKKEMKKQPVVKLLKAKALTKPKPKTELQKQKMMEAKKEKEEMKKKQEREIRKKAVEEEKKRVMDRKKEPKEKTSIKSKKQMKKQDEVRPKEKVGKPKFDPKKIKVIKPKPKEEPKVEKPKEEPKVDKGGIPRLKKYDVIEYKTKGNKKVVAFVSSTFAKNTYVMNHIILKDDGSFDESEKNTMDLPDLQLTKSRKFKFIGKLDPDQEKVIFDKEPMKDKPKDDKKEILVVFKDIITGFKEILEGVDPEDRNKVEIKSMKIILDKLNKGSMSFSTSQKGLIKRAIDAYLDMDFVGDPELETQVKIARELKKKYK